MLSVDVQGERFFKGGRLAAEQKCGVSISGSPSLRLLGVPATTARRSLRDGGSLLLATRRCGPSAGRDTCIVGIAVLSANLSTRSISFRTSSVEQPTGSSRLLQRAKGKRESKAPPFLPPAKVAIVSVKTALFRSPPDENVA